MKERLRALDCLVLIAIGPFLLYPSLFPFGLVIVALAAPILVLLYRWRVDGTAFPSTPANGPLFLLLLIFVPLGLWASPAFSADSWPAVTRLMWGLFGFVVALNWGRDSAEFEQPISAFLGLGLMMTLIGIIGIRDPFGFGPLSALRPLLPSSVIGQSGFHQNEVGGMITFFLPLAFAIGLNAALKQSKKPSTPLLSISIATVFILGISLLLTRSRSGLLGVGLACSIIMLLSGKKGRLLFMAAVLLGSGGLLLTSFGQQLTRTIIGGVETWRYSTSGWRLYIWDRAEIAIEHFPFTGVGLGAFRSVLREVYTWQQPVKSAIPQVEPLDLTDAHQFYLQTLLDFGLIGGGLFFLVLLIMLAIAIIAVRQHENRPIAIGLLGSLIAFLVYGIFDSISIGAVPGIGMWVLFALILVAARQPLPTEQANHQFKLSMTLSGGVAILMLFLALFIGDGVGANVAGLQQMTAIVGGDVAEMISAENQPRQTNCGTTYLSGRSADARGDTTARDSAWAQTVRCDDELIALLANLAPQASTLAASAVQHHPQAAEAYFWAATAENDSLQAIDFYRRGLEIDPNDGLRWTELGDRLEGIDNQGAIDAYLTSCENGDPPAGGCRAAGRLAERLGDNQAAIDYYRQSYRATTQQLADNVDNRPTERETKQDSNNNDP